MPGQEADDSATQLIEKVRQSGRTLLTEFESKQLLAFYGIPTVDTRLAATEDEAAMPRIHLAIRSRSS